MADASFLKTFQPKLVLIFSKTKTSMSSGPFPHHRLLKGLMDGNLIEKDDHAGNDEAVAV